MHAFHAKLYAITTGCHSTLDEFTLGTQRFGFVVERLPLDGRCIGIRYREWAPNASAAFLTGDFNGWQRDTHPMQRDAFGVWEIWLPAPLDGSLPIAHASKVKISLRCDRGDGSTHHFDRVPAWITATTQDPSTQLLEGVFWQPPQPFAWKKERLPPLCPSTALKIYEAHVGICTPAQRVSTYAEFAREIVPRVAAAGYNAIQLMAVMEHAYYASFGYQVTNFFAPSSRFGTPDDLRALVDVAHEYGIRVLLDVVHSHACKNVLDGLNAFDGGDAQYFHAGPRGYHTLWDSRLFDYGAIEVLRFLLSNLRYWVDEFRFDGFRFDGVTSMLYAHHGIGVGFSGDYREYFGDALDIDACVYLMLANHVLQTIYAENPPIRIAEDVSGMPGLCRPILEGGFGFEYRLAMAIPDMWITLLRTFSDESWSMQHIAHTLTNRRYAEKTVAYAESHDQALVGDKTIAFWLMDAEMYWNMSRSAPLTPIIDRGMALHKMIRLLSLALGGEAYLNFMGNEFGHPEWLDFPRAGNANSFLYARRQFALADDPQLRYAALAAFDAAMLAAESIDGWLVSAPAHVSTAHDADKLLAFERARCIFVFNFHATQSYVAYRIGVDASNGGSGDKQSLASYVMCLTTDDAAFGGHGRLDACAKVTRYEPENVPTGGLPHSVLLYVPARTAIVLRRCA